MSRADTVMMARIKNEARWIRASLERTWQVCSKVVIWDDGSTDATMNEAVGSMNNVGFPIITPVPGHGGYIAKGTTEHGPAELHFLRSPYADPLVRPAMRRNELRDKNCLWWYVKGAVDFKYVLCLDGDEILSQRALRAFPEMWQLLASKDYDWLNAHFVYLWDDPGQRRVDGIYGDDTDAMARLRFPRMFSILNLSEQQLYDTRFHWLGTRGGLHCGSIPQEGFHDIKPKSTTMRDFQVIHYGYLDAAMRQAKYEFYNEIDPNNEFEGRYLHIISQPNKHAPKPIDFVPYIDE